MRTSLVVAVVLLGGIARADYANVDGVKMYYESHGSGGTPVVLLHGGTATIAYEWSKQIPAWSKTRRVIAVEQMGHGHTADVPSRAMSYENMAEDTAKLIEQLKIAPVDVVGHSDGGILALYLAMRHPTLVRKIVLSGANYRVDGMDPEIIKWLQNATAEGFPKEARDAYVKAAPDGGRHWAQLFGRVRAMWLGWKGIERGELGKIVAPAMVMAGDDDAIRLEHTIDLWRAIPRARLFVVPGTGHSTFNQRPEWVNPIVQAFFDEPMPPKK